jgi:ankyrin repeat protein
MVNSHTGKIKILTLMEYQFIKACRNGNLEEAMMIYKSGVNINVDGDEPFIVSCLNGNIEIAKWLLSLPNNKININTTNDHAFRWSCRNGYLKLAKWLISLPNNNININVRDDAAFVWSCEKGHMEVAKWLLSLPNNNININAIDDEAFMWSCKKGHIEIIKLLIKTKKIDNEIINKYFKYYNKEIIKLIFDIGYTPLNTEMKKYHEEYKEMKLKMKHEVNKYMIPELTDLVYEYC